MHSYVQLEYIISEIKQNTMLENLKFGLRKDLSKKKISRSGLRRNIFIKIESYSTSTGQVLKAFIY
jgi:hypothetical protein